MAKDFGHEDAGLATPETLVSIVENFGIRTFLGSSNKRYLVGPKGSGKTLILLRKAIDQRRQADALCIPSDPDLPVDRLTAAEHIGKRFNFKVGDPAENSLAWTAVWKHCILRSVLHHLRDEILTAAAQGAGAASADTWHAELMHRRLKEQKDAVSRLLSDVAVYPLRPFQYYAELGARLDARPGELSAVRHELRLMESLLQLSRREAYVFLDNLDDYYERNPHLWFNSMYGQFRAVREISLAHRHIHLFTSIRQDVYSQFADEMTLQYYDYVTELRYSKSELLSIFQAGIQRLDTSLLMRPDLRDSDPWKAFFGESVLLRNGRVGCEEHVKDYLYRHSLGRPRDLVHLGTVLLNERPAEGFSTEHVRKAVARAERDIAEQYLAEVGPLLDPRLNLKEFVEQFVRSNVLSNKDVARITADYRKRQAISYELDGASEIANPFETLYGLGLFGIELPLHDSSETIQQFEPPGHGLRDRVSRKLPTSDRYFLHPILGYLQHPNQSSRDIVVGNGYPACRRLNQ
jgi:hypothetical protein